MNAVEITINITISLLAGAAGGFGIFKSLGKKWVENWFAKDLKRYEHKLDVLKIKDEIKFNKNQAAAYYLPVKITRATTKAYKAIASMAAKPAQP